MGAHVSDDAPVEAKPAPGLPEIQDEAADTPMWVPALGLGLFVIVALWLVISAQFVDDEAPPEEAAIAAPAVAAPTE